MGHPGAPRVSRSPSTPWRRCVHQSPAPPAVLPPRGGGSAAAALQAADSWRDVLAASTLVVLPDEESVAWQRQRIHRKRRAGGAARAPGGSRGRAARDKLGAGGEREQCVNDARFARLVAAAAAPTTEGGAGGGGARVDDDDDEEESAIRSSSVHRPHPLPPSSRSAEERAGDVADALEALRALGSLAPLPWVDERHPGDPVAMRPHVSRLIQKNRLVATVDCAARRHPRGVGVRQARSV